MSKISTFVHIIESPSSIDLLDGRTEGRSLSAFLDLADIPNCYNLVTDSNTFEMALRCRLRKAIEDFEALPIIHFSAHGNKHEIGLTNGDSLSWPLLAKELAPLNDIMNGSLVVCLSACSGLAANNMIRETNIGLPMKTLVSSLGKIGWHEAAVGYATFYNHFLVLGNSVDESVLAMKAASGCADFKGTDSASIKERIDEFRSMPLEKMRDYIALLKKQGTISSSTGDQVERLAEQLGSE